MSIDAYRILHIVGLGMLLLGIAVVAENLPVLPQRDGEKFG